MQLLDVEIDDKYTLEKGRVFLSGTQALARLLLMQKARDRAAGLNTAGFVSGYRGSPLGGLDMQIWRASRLIGEDGIHFAPGLNEDLAATAVWGTQQIKALPDANVDGVFGMWYGKGPGVDRSGDPLKHANYAGTTEYGGVLAVFGDDHPGKSSTVAHQSEQSMAAFGMPVLYPATVQDYLDFGLHGWALSRYSGLWVSFKCVNESVENTASVDVDPERVKPVLPEGLPTGDKGLYLNLDYSPQADDIVVQRYRMPRVAAYARANKLDYATITSTRARYGIVAAGKAYLDVLDALRCLGIDQQRAEQLGICVYKVGMIWPLEGEGLREFASGLQELFFVEEKRAFLEEQASKILYNLPDEKRPAIFGKRDEDGVEILPSDIQLDVATVAQVIAERLKRAGIADSQIDEHLGKLVAQVELAASATGAELIRTPYFCSGCPHNRSTKLPEGSIAMSGIGCHGMAAMYRPDTVMGAQMGGEGAAWIGASPFTDVKHVFQNLGDGTYNHSGLLAIRAAVAANINITYKILFNDAVAMTGGQPVEGQLTVDKVTRQVAAEGVEAIVVVSDEPEKYGSNNGFAAKTRIRHREELEKVQKQLRDTSGVTVLIYDQTCAAEKRRRRKRGEFPDPNRRAFINDLVCEGCGDCSTVSTCVSIQPKDTDFGRKRMIDQSSCNKDFSCVEGFCPSFVSVVGGGLRKPPKNTQQPLAQVDLPEPVVADIETGYNILINGVGGTGVVTVGAVIAMAAHLEGRGVSVYDMTGLSQKGGTVFSHLKVAKAPTDIGATRIGMGDADLVIGCDLVVTGGRDCLVSCLPGTTHAVIDSHLVPTATFQLNSEISLSVDTQQNVIRDTLGADYTHLVNATSIARLLLGDTIGANLFTVGFAAQKGLLPVSVAALEKAVQLNGIAVDFNLQALQLGRLAAHDAEAVSNMMEQNSASKAAPALDDSLDAIVARRHEYLVGYQNEQYADRYRALVEKVKTREAEVSPGSESLSRAVARYLFKVMAYKDEYEVARLYTDGRFEKAVAEQFQGDYSIRYHLAPPLFSRRHPSTGLPAKREYGPWMMKSMKKLAGLKRLRGTAMDPFGYTRERRDERRTRDGYIDMIDNVLGELSAVNLQAAVKLAEVPEQIRGFGHIKAQNLVKARKLEADLLETFKHAESERRAATDPSTIDA